MRLSLHWKILAGYLAVAGVGLGVAGWLSLERFEASDMKQLQAGLTAQARLVAAYEQEKWPARRPSTAELLRYLMDQHGLKRADLVPFLGTPGRVGEVLRGRKELSLAMVQRLRARFRVPAELLLPPVRKAPARRAAKRTAA